MMETVGIFTCYALGMGFAFGVVFFLMTVVEHHGALRDLREAIRDFRKRIDALERGKMDRTVRGEDDGKVKAKR